ncbi:hypothetical protein GCM10022280_19740 [Sphingomonas swuensis]|uniref:DUF2336 domain-containing protein n=1 Tax=Sphingomonas swuensis TaxID=977800 RepID=A0ABP7T1K8_9SPHN
MSEEWPIAAPPLAGGKKAAATVRPVDGDRRLSAAVRDFFLEPGTRLTEQERALMTAMLHGLVDRIADELRARVDPSTAAACPSTAAELVADLTRAGLLQDEALVGLLLRRADIQRLAQSAGEGGRTRLQRWTADEDAEVAASAMTLLTARGRGRDRYGRIALDMVDLPQPLSFGLVQVVAAALGRLCSAPSDNALALAAADLLAERPQGRRLEEIEAELAEALGSERRQEAGLLVSLAADGEAPLLAAILAAEAGIAPEEGWRCLLGGGEQLALLLRMAGIIRREAAALLAHAGPALGFGDPVKAIEAYDALAQEQVDAARAELELPPAFRRAKAVLAHHG